MPLGTPNACSACHADRTAAWAAEAVIVGGGTYLRAAPTWIYNFENDNYSVPLGVGIGQVINKVRPYNFFVEPHFSVADRRTG